MVCEGLPSDAIRRMHLNEFLEEIGCEPQRIEFSPLFIRTMYYDTLRAMRKGVIRPIIKTGHWDHDQRQKGYGIGLKLIRIPLSSGAMGWAIDLHYTLNECAELEQAQNYYPNHSIEWSEDLVDDAGNPHGILLGAVAIMGTDEQSILDLPRGYKIYKEKEQIDATAIQGLASANETHIDITRSAHAA